MKKAVVLFAFAVCVLLVFAGCSQNKEPEQKEEERTTAQREPVVLRELTDEDGRIIPDQTVTLNMDALRPYYDETDLENFEKNGGMKTLGSLCGNMMFSEYGYAKEYEERRKNEKWGYYNFKEDKLTLLDPVEYVMNIGSRAGNMIMNDTDYYIAYAGSKIGEQIDEQADVNEKVFFKISAADNSVTKLPSIFSTGLLPMCKLDDSHFLYVTFEDTESSFSSTVWKYDCKTESAEILIQKKYAVSENQDSATRKYTTIQQASAYDGEIYLLCVNWVGEKANLTIQKYDGNGVMLDEFNADSMKKYMSKSSSITFSVQHDFIWVTAYASAGSGAIFRIYDGVVEEFLRSASAYRNLKLDFVRASDSQYIYSSEKCSYLIFKTQTMGGGVANCFYALNTANGKITQYDLYSKNDIVFLKDMCGDEYGNLIISVSIGSENRDVTQGIGYYIENEFIKKNLA